MELSTLIAKMIAKTQQSPLTRRADSAKRHENQLLSPDGHVIDKHFAGTHKLCLIFDRWYLEQKCMLREYFEAYSKT